MECFALPVMLPDLAQQINVVVTQMHSLAFHDHCRNTQANSKKEHNGF